MAALSGSGGHRPLWWHLLPLSALSSPKEAVRQFTPSWFTLVMSTGIVGTLIGTFPYDAPGKLQAGWAFWWLALALLCVFLTMLACRFVFFWHDAMALFGDPFQALFLGAIPPSFAVIINGMPLFLARYWGKGAVMHAAVVLWWVQTGLALACTLLLPFFMLTRHRYKLDHMTAVLLMPLLPCVVASGSGGIVARNAVNLDAARAVAYMSFLLWGIGVLLCFIVLTIYYRRLMQHSLPPKEAIISSFMPVGPMGMSALALLHLGPALVRIFPPPTPDQWASLVSAGPPTDPAALEQLFAASVGAVANAGGALVALVLWGNGIWWLAVAIASVATVMVRASLPFNIGWWGFVFPLGVYAAAANELWQRFPGMEAMRVTAACLISCVILLWAVVFSYTLVKGWNGSLFHAPCLATSSQQQQQQVISPALEAKTPPCLADQRCETEFSRSQSEGLSAAAEDDDGEAAAAAAAEEAEAAEPAAPRGAANRPAVGAPPPGLLPLSIARN